MVVIPQLVSTGALTPHEGAAVLDMIRAEDPVVFAACRVAGVVASENIAPAMLTSPNDFAGDGGGRSRGGVWKGRTQTGGERRGWSREAQISMASMLKIVLAHRENRRVGDNASGVSNDGMANGATRRGWKGVEGATSATESFGGVGGGLWDKTAGSFIAETCGGGGDGSSESGCCGSSRGGTKSDAREVSECFQSDIIALADAALVTRNVRFKNSSGS